MKKTLLTAIICAFTATTAVLAQQHQQTISFTGPTQWVPGTTVSLDVFLTFSGYTALSVSYWLEVPNALAPFIEITDVHYFTFPDPNQPPTFPILFNSTVGTSSGYMAEPTDLGGSATVPPGTNYHITTITFSLAVNAPNGSFTMLTTSHAPRISEVADNIFNDNNIPAAPFVINVVPEPSTLALLGLAAVGSAVVAYHRRKS